MNNQYSNIFQKSIKTISLFLLGFLFLSQLGYGQCPVDPVGCTLNPAVSAMPDTMFICEGVTSVLLNPSISGGNYSWFREDKGALGTYNPAGNSSSLQTITVEANYYVCHQQSNTGCYIKDKVVVHKKSLATQLGIENEFVAPSGLSICSGQAKPFFNTAGNTVKYKYDWTPGSLFSGATNMKNAKFTATYPKGSSSAGNFTPALTIIEKSSGCSAKLTFKPIVYPPPNPDFGTIKSSYCQNVPEELSVRVFVVKNYSIASATLQIGTDPVINLTSSDFSKISSDMLIPNTLGEVVPPATVGKELNVKIPPLIMVDVVKRQVSSTMASPSGGTIPVKFSMVTDLGCTANVSTQITVNPSTPYTVQLTPTNQTSFCVNDAKAGPLTAKDGFGNFGVGTFSGPGVIKNLIDNKFYFHPDSAKAGSHNITFSVPGTSCSGGGSQIVTVKPAPKPKIVGRANVCPGSFDIEYKDTAKLAATITPRTWRLLDENYVNTTLLTPTTNGTVDSILVRFDQAYPKTKAFIIKINNDLGCIASDTIEVSLDPLKKSPEPIGPTTGCLDGNPNVTLKYQSVSAASSAFTHTWNIVGGVTVPAGATTHKVDVSWNVSATTRTISVTDVSTQVTPCNLPSNTLAVNFISAPDATIDTTTPLPVCAGTPLHLKVKNFMTGVTYTWPEFNVKGRDVNVKVPETIGTFTYYLTAELPNCPKTTSYQELLIRFNPSDPLPLDVIEHCFDDDPILPITVRAQNTTLPNKTEWNIDPTDIQFNSTTLDVDTAGTYKAKITFLDLNNKCATEGEVTVVEICNAKFFLPKAFSPNGDTYNDTLKIFGNHFTDFDFKIFSRWGEVIFSTKNPKETWDGTYAGLPMPEGTYPWSVRYESFNAKKKKVTEKKDGSISLIR